MFNSIALTLHIFGGSISIISGMTALFARKGSLVHIRSGTIFFYGMILMSLCAIFMAISYDQKTNIIAGSLTLYLVLTAQRTAVNKSGKSGLIEYSLSLLALIVVITGMLFGIETFREITHSNSGFSPLDFFLYFFTGMAALGLILDSVMIGRGGITGRRRVARHVWRMCFALWIATSSFFLGQPQVFPDFLSHPLIRSLPVILVVVMWLFWNVYVFFAKRFRA